MVSGARSSDGSIIPVFFVFFSWMLWGVLSCWCVMASESPYPDRLCLVYRNWSSVAVPTFGTTSYNPHYGRPSVSWFRHDPPTNATRANFIQRVIHYTHARRISFEYKPPPRFDFLSPSILCSPFIVSMLLRHHLFWSPNQLTPPSCPCPIIRLYHMSVFVFELPPPHLVLSEVNKRVEPGGDRQTPEIGSGSGKGCPRNSENTMYLAQKSSVCTTYEEGIAHIFC